MKIIDAQVRLSSLWGVIDRQHNELIAARLLGARVLDIGCGYGSLVSYLTTQGFDAQGVDFDPESVTTANRLFPRAKVSLENAESLDGFASKSFDSIVLKDTLHHLVCEGDFGKAATTFRRLLVPGGRLVILDPNPTWILRLARRLSAHDDVEATPDRAQLVLHENAFAVKGMEFYEMIGLPLSGGYVGIRFVPNVGVINQAVAGCNRGLSRLVNRLGLGRQLCWRYMIHADSTEAMDPGQTSG
jgi:SAM-dependent methyltransferase